MKTDIWEKEFSDNFKPIFFEKVIKKFEIYRRVAILGLLPKDRAVIVDLACGNGELLFEAQKYFKTLIGFDIAENRVKKAKKSLENIKNKIVDIHAHDLDKGIPLPNNYADVVTCEASLSYLYDLNLILKEIYRILKKKGYFIVEVPNFAFLPRRISLLMGRLPKTSAFRGDTDSGALHYFTYKSLREFVEKRGFRLCEKTNSGLFAKLRKIRPELFAGDIIYKFQKSE